MARARARQSPLRRLRKACDTCHESGSYTWQSGPGEHRAYREAKTGLGRARHARAPRLAAVAQAVDRSGNREPDQRHDTVCSEWLSRRYSMLLRTRTWLSWLPKVGMESLMRCAGA